MSGAGVGVDLGGDARLEQQDDVGPAELEVAELVALAHLGALDRGEHHRADVGHPHRDDSDDADVARR